MHSECRGPIVVLVVLDIQARIFRIGVGVIYCPSVKVDIFIDCRAGQTTGSKSIYGTSTHKQGCSANPLEEYRRIKTTPLGIQAETIVHLWNSRISYCNFIRGVYNTITINIKILDVTGTNRSKILFGAIIYLFLTLKKSKCYQSKRLTIWFADQIGRAH